MNTLYKMSCGRRCIVFVAAAWMLAGLPGRAVPDAPSDLARKAESGDADAMLDYGRHLLTVDAGDALTWIRKAAAAYDLEENWPGLLGACLDVAEHATDETETRHAREHVADMIDRATEGAFELDTIPFPELQPLLERAYDAKAYAAAALIGKRLREAGELKQAFDWYSKAATKGYPPAMVQVGLMYSNGDGVETNMEKAASWLRPANVKKSASGKYLLAECFLYGKGVQRNPELGAKLLHEAIELQESGRALDLLATCYHKGWGVDADPLKAAELYQQACERNYYNAYANLAVLHMTGAGVTRNEGLAVELLQEGIETGNNPLCMYFLGLARLDGKGIRKNKRKARTWLIQAAEAGNGQAATWCRANDVPFSIHP